MQCVGAHPRHIDLGGPWLFWAAPPSSALVASLENLGQIVPALADFRPEKPRLVAGHARARALAEIRGAVLRVVSLDDLEPLPEALERLPEEVRLGLYYLDSNLERRPNDPMLVAAGRFFASRLSFAAFLDLAGPRLGLAPGARQSRDLAAWLSLPADLDDLLAAGKLPLGAAPDLVRLGADDLAALRPFFQELRFSRNALRQFATWMSEAAKTRGVPVAALVREAKLDRRPAEGLSPNDALARLTDAARRLRYPHLTGLTERFQTLASGLSGGALWRLVPSQGFESDAVTLECRVGDRAGLERAVRELGAMSLRPEWERLWTLAEAPEDVEAPEGSPEAGHDA